MVPVEGVGWVKLEVAAGKERAVGSEPNDQ